MEPSQPKAPKSAENKSSSIHDEKKIDELKQKMNAENSTSEDENPVEDDIDELETLKAKIIEQQEVIDKNKENLMRVAADFQNSKKRLERDKEETVKFANEKILNEFLPLYDSLEMTVLHANNTEDENVKAIHEGVALVLKQFLQAFDKCGVTVITGENEPFNPHLQEAISVIPSDEVKPDHVITVNRKGFKLNDKVIRPAMVTVASSG